MAGKVKINDSVASKASQKVKTEDILVVTEPEKFVSRGGHKLEAAIEHFKIQCEGRICLDIGASTGGFTDCLLQHGARKVYAVDVGKNQLDWKVRSNPKVVVFDETNARYLKKDQFEEPVTLVTIDASFISLTKLLSAAYECSADEADFVTLIKPQFEAGREKVESGGVVRDPAIHDEVIGNVREFAEQNLKITWHGHIESPLRGPAGNKEFLAFFSKKS